MRRARSIPSCEGDGTISTASASASAAGGRDPADASVRKRQKTMEQDFSALSIHSQQQQQQQQQQAVLPRMSARHINDTTNNNHMMHASVNEDECIMTSEDDDDDDHEQKAQSRNILETDAARTIMYQLALGKQPNTSRAGLTILDAVDAKLEAMIRQSRLASQGGRRHQQSNLAKAKDDFDFQYTTATSTMNSITADDAGDAMEQDDQVPTSTNTPTTNPTTTKHVRSNSMPQDYAWNLYANTNGNSDASMDVDML